jgi:hypothetical protein
MTDKDKMRITMQLGVGIKDIKELNVGDLGTMNGWYPPYGNGSWMRGGLQRHIMQLCREQGVPFEARTRRNLWRCYEEYWADEYNIGYSVDSSD